MKFFSDFRNALRHSYEIALPLFSKRRLKENVGIAAAYIGLNVLEFYTTKFLIEKTEKDSQDIYSDLSFSLGSVVLLVGMQSLRNFTDAYLATVLDHSIKIDLLDKSFSNDTTLIGVDFLQKLEAKGNADFNPISLSIIMENHSRQFSRAIVDATTSLLFNAFSVGIKLFQICDSVNDRRIVILATSYGLLAVYINTKLTESRIHLADEKSIKHNKTYNHFHHLINNNIQIAALRVSGIEKNELSKNFIELDSLFQKETKLILRDNIFLQSAFRVFSPISDVLGPSLIHNASTNPIAINMFKQQINTVMLSILNTTFKLSQGLPDLKIGLEKLIKFKRYLDQWNIFHSKRKFEQDYNRPKFRIRDLNVHIPTQSFDLSQFQKEMSDSNLLCKADLNLEPGKRYRLDGASGVGKSTILKAILGLWPCTTGKVQFPCSIDEIYFISQKPFLPIRSTLLAAITYPDTNIEQKSVERMLMVLGLSNHIPNLLSTEQWNDKLSGGEMQRIVFIRAILKKPLPKILIMDEATASLDSINKNIISVLIDECLPKDTTVIYTEHQTKSKYHCYSKEKNKEEQKNMKVETKSNSSSNQQFGLGLYREYCNKALLREKQHIDHKIIIIDKNKRKLRIIT